MLADRVSTLAPSGTVNIPDKARSLSRSGIQVIDLAEGQPHYDTPSPIKESAKKALDSGMVHYIESAGLPDLLEALAEKLEQENGIFVPQNQIMVTVGAKQAIFSALFCTLNPNDRVLIPDPFWGTYSALVEVMGGMPVSVPLKEDGEGFSIDLNFLEREADRGAKMIILNSPHNPTGMVIPKVDLEFISDVCRRKKILALSDEIYEKIVYDNARHYSIASFPGMEDYAITVNGFSKAYSMTGWRLGYVASSKEITSKMLLLQQHTVTHPTSFVEQAGVTAIQECGQFTEEMIREYKTCRDFFVERINSLGVFQCPKPKGAFYAFPKVASPALGPVLAEMLLEKAHVLCVPGGAFGKFGENHLRFVYSQPRELLYQALERIEMVFEETKKAEDGEYSKARGIHPI